MEYTERFLGRKADIEKMSTPTDLGRRVGEMRMMPPTPHEVKKYPGGVDL